ncbi:MAG: AAA family ATPase [Intestinibacter sp.]|uniref:AAA family ATPase n=1 Tax=Intestinibacter sp. TaxID=1965304 RepID=UPI002A817305|nr:AAA family ATPase [Intestinibacter sp.]MDY4575663.1 AAA family ATPase [Intestinibacter sp.]
MFHYSFTHDLRITNLEERILETSDCIKHDTVPSAREDKSKNNYMNAIRFYFNLHKGNNCNNLAYNGEVKKVIINFIKKFQFPNFYKKALFDNQKQDEIKLAPLRVVLQLLFVMKMIGLDSYITKQEVLNFIFYNENIAKQKNMNLYSLIGDINKYREENIFPENIITDADKRMWKHEDRDLGDMMKILEVCNLTYNDANCYYLNDNNFSEQDYLNLLEIVNFNEFWEGEDLESYRKYMDIDECIDTINIDESERISGGENLLFYGVPGVGKSYIIKKDYCDNEEYMERVVFYPDYTYSDFVGQILPKSVGGNIKYEFIEGPFTRLLKKAYQNPTEKYYLIIEEINRGNAPTIFGEVFQLLDRDSNGNSEYSISNSDIAKKVYGDENCKVRIPSNMYILATMNTSDQNVFTLDTAFQRRWNMHLIKNDIENADSDFVDTKILDTDVTWKQFNIVINNIILKNNIQMLSSEDKRLGVYFIKKSDLIYNYDEENSQIEEEKRLVAAKHNRYFAEKIIKYLWDDAFRFCRDIVFKMDTNNCLEDIIEEFTSNKQNNRFLIFKEDIYNQLFK